MNYTMIENATFADLKHLPLKGNLLKGSFPEILDAEFNPVPVRSGSLLDIVRGDRAMSDRSHVQLLSELPMTITYQIAEGTAFNKILISTVHFESDYGYGRYEVYLSHERESLYDPSNLLAEYDRRGTWVSEDFFKGTAQIYCFLEPQKYNYLGIKVTHGSVCDGVVRMDFVGLFEEHNSGLAAFTPGLGVELLSEASVTVFEDKKIYELKGHCTPSALLIKQPSSARFFRWNQGESSFAREISSAPVGMMFGEASYLLYSCSGEADYFGIQGEVTEASLYSNTVSVSVHTDTIINPDFLGAGTNILPTALMEESLERGYHPAYWQLEKEAIRTMRPAVARIWFQNDWFHTAPDEYDFESDKMKALYEYLDVLKETETEIELDFSFVTGNKIQSWYCFQDVPDIKRSAPRDLEVFGRSVVAALTYLWDQKGYTNIKYITLSNEPEGPNFKVPGGDMRDKMKYYAKTLRAVHDALTKAGLRDHVEIWGPEDSSTVDDDWLTAMAEYAPDVIDRYTKHSYITPVDELMKSRTDRYKDACGNRPVCLSEFGSGIVLWRKSNIGYFIAAASGGLSTTLQWALSSAILPDPIFGLYSDNICLYRNLDFKNDKLHVNEICNEYAMLMRYVPRHGAVVKTVCSNENDIRATAITDKEDNLTIVVESRDSGNRELQIHLERELDRPLYRITYNLTDGGILSTLMPEAVRVLVNGKTITDRLSEKHTAAIYTTIKPQPQIALSSDKDAITAGESARIACTTVNCEQPVVYTVTNGNAAVTPDGTVTAALVAAVGEIIAVTASVNGEVPISKTILFQVQ